MVDFCHHILFSEFEENFAGGMKREEGDGISPKKC
jgi:hypothetical protein